MSIETWKLKYDKLVGCLASKLANLVLSRTHMSCDIVNSSLGG